MLAELIVHSLMNQPFKYCCLFDLTLGIVGRSCKKRARLQVREQHENDSHGDSPSLRLHYYY